MNSKNLKIKQPNKKPGHSPNTLSIRGSPELVLKNILGKTKWLI